jgi:pyruvate/2-oxoglutarate dehydrogenase complex dihydrolipoamide acyltransferase (E2) component
MPHELWLASLAQRVGGPARLALLAMFGTALAGAGFAFAQDDQQARCMQLQQELASARGGGSSQLPAIDRQIQDATRVYRGTKAAMDDAGCFERGFLIFGRGLVRTPKCLQMNDRVEDARRQVDQLQEQRAAIAGGGGNRRRQAELMDALARNGCGGQYQQPVRRDSGGGGLFGWFGRERVEEPDQQYSNQPVYRSIDPNGRYRAVCVRTCDGFYFPITYQTYAGRLAQDAAQCQASCAAPAELYVYRNPGQDMEQAISLNGVPYQELPNAFKFKTTYVKGCSCKESEYNPTEIEAANQKAEATPAAGTKKKTAAAAAPAPQPAAAQAPQQLDINVTGAIPNSGAQPATEAEAATPQDAAPPAQQSSIAKSQPAPAQ